MATTKLTVLTKAGFKHLSENERIIHGVLKSIRVSNQRHDYEDLVQICRIYYVEAYVKHHSNYEETGYMPKFNVYVFQQLKWRVLDYLRKDNRRSVELGNESKEHDGEDLLSGLPASSPVLEDELANHEFLNRLFMLCNDEEQAYLHARLLLDLGTMELVQHLNVTKRRVYYLKSQIGKKALKLMQVHDRT